MCLSVNGSKCFDKNGNLSYELLAIEIKRTIKLIKETRKNQNRNTMLVEVIESVKSDGFDSCNIGDVFIALNMDNYIILIERIRDGYKANLTAFHKNVKILENPYPCKYKFNSTLSFIDNIDIDKLP